MGRLSRPLSFVMFEVPQRQQLKSIHRLLNVPPVATVKLGNAYQFEKFGTGNSLLRYGIRIRCSKRLPGVRDAFSEAFGVKNRLLRYGRNIRYRKRPPTVRDAFSKARETADSTDCGQPPAAPNASSEACRAKSSTCPPDAASVRETPTARR